MSVRALWIQVGLLFAVLYLALLWARPMITPDEARYGAMGADMLASGDWMKLRMAGFTYYEKPPLGTWLVAGSIACFGHNAFAIRLPCALAALTSALAAGMVTRRATGRRELGPLAAMVQLTTLLPFLLGTVLLLDPIFTAFTSLTLAWFLAACQTGGRARAKWLLASGAAAGLGFMTKGLLAFAIPGVAAAAFLCWERRWKDLCAMPWLPLLGAVLAGGPLALLLHRSEPGFWNYFVVVEHLRRFATPDINQHPEPWWVLTVVLVGGSLFWLAHWPRVTKALRTGEGWRSGIRFCLAWIVPPLALLSLSKGKLPTYVLPLFPPVAVLVTMGLVRWREGVTQSRDAGTTIALLVVRVLALGAFMLALLGTQTLGLPRLWLGPEAPRWVLLGIALLAWSMLEASSHRATEARSWLMRTAWIPVPGLLCMLLLLPDALLSPQKLPWELLQRHAAALRAAPHLVVSNANGHAIAWTTGRSDFLVAGDPSEFDNELHIASEQARLVSTEALPSRVAEWLPQGPVALVISTDQADALAKRFGDQVRAIESDRDLTVLVLGRAERSTAR